MQRRRIRGITHSGASWASASRGRAGAAILPANVTFFPSGALVGVDTTGGLRFLLGVLGPALLLFFFFFAAGLDASSSFLFLGVAPPPAGRLASACSSSLL